MGLERVGKTSTIKSFFKKEFDPNEPFTDAIAVKKTYIEDSPDVWNEAPENMSPVSFIYENEASVLLAKKMKQQKSPVSFINENEASVKKNMKQQKYRGSPVHKKLLSSTALLSTSSSLSSSSSSSSSSTLTMAPIEKVPKGIADKAKKLWLSEEATTDLKTPNNAFIINIWDFGGQPIYSVIQRMLFASFAVVSVVFNLEHDLDRHARVRDPTTGEFYDHRMTYMDFIICYIRSVYMNRSHFDLKDIPPILLIGTHCNSDKLGKTKDERKSKVKEMCSKILEALKDKPYGNMVFPKIFTIENSAPFHLSNATEIMTKILTSSKKMVRRLPLKWLVFQQEIQALKKEHICLETSKVMELIKKCGINDEKQQNLLLEYLHNTGEILYYPKDRDLKDIIVVDLMKVVNLSTAIVTIKEPEFQTMKLLRAWKRLNTGILEKHLLIYLWEKLGVKDELVDTFAILLQRFGLMCKKYVSEGQEEVFYVLSRLRPVCVETSPTDYDEKRAISFFHDFSNYLPDDIFQRGVTKFIEKFQMKDHPPMFHYEYVELNVDEKHFVVLNVVTINHRKMFKTTIVRIEVERSDDLPEQSITHSPEEDDPEPTVCKEVLKFLHQELSNLCPSDDIGVELKTYIHCTCCGKFHVVSDFNRDVLPCRAKGMNIKRYRHILGDGARTPANNAIQPKPAGSHGGETHSLSNSTADDFQRMLEQVSTWFDRQGTINKLKVLYKDKVTSYRDLQKVERTMELFRLLQSAGHLKQDNVNILIDTINVTGTMGVLQASELLRTTYENTKPHAHVFTSHRRNLIKFGDVISTEGIRTIGNLKDMIQSEYKDQWIMIMKLETMGVIRENDMQSFLGLLRNNNLILAAEKLEEGE